MEAKNGAPPVAKKSRPKVKSNFGSFPEDDSDLCSFYSSVYAHINILSQSPNPMYPDAFSGTL
jgi:hypothetical protein